MEGHTQGSIGLYIKDWKLMLVSDATCPFIWIFLEESTPVSVYVKMLEKVLELEFDNFLVGHGARLFPRQKMIDFYEVAKNINLEESVKVSFNNFDNANSYCYTKGVMYNQDHCGIVFDPNKL
jgi:glyoxylase-like metal-dependent hydrolase (beta-lactamase superfamily II)